MNEVACAEPVFVHSSFRVGSTWLWACLRRNAAALAYCEIFHDGHATLTPERAASEGAASWASKHPPDATSYFREFVPLLRPEGGVRGYEPWMAFGRFAPTDGLSGAESRYVEGLIGHARALGRVPVLTATRSLGRVAALRAAFGGTHIVLYRNMFRQWASYTEQWLQGNTYFIGTIAQSIAGAADDPELSALAPLVAGGVDPRRVETFQAMLLLHATLYERAMAACDLVLDVDRLAEDAAHRQEMEAALAAQTGLAVDLSTVRASMAYSLVDAGPAAPLLEGLEARARQAGVREPGLLRLRAAVQEYDAYRRSHGALADALLARCAAREEAAEALRAELAAMSAQGAAREQAAEALRAELAAMSAQSAAREQAAEALRAELAAMSAQGAARERAAEALRAELAAMSAQGAARERAAEALRAELTAIRASRSWRITAPVRRMVDTLRRHPAGGGG